MSSSEEIKPIALSIIYLCWLKASVTYLVENSEKKVNFKNFYSNLLEGLGLIWRHFWAWLCLTNTAKLLKRKCEVYFWMIKDDLVPDTTQVLSVSSLLHLKCLVNLWLPIIIYLFSCMLSLCRQEIRRKPAVDICTL